MERAMFVYTTFPDEETALSIGEAIVATRLAACVNVIPGMRSVYRWEGRIERGAESIAIFKTRESLGESLRAALEEQHPYDTPVILFVPLAGGDQDTLAWIMTETDPGNA